MKRQQLRPGTAAILHIDKRAAVAVVVPYQSIDKAVVKAIEVLDVEPGRYVIVPIQLWEQTVRKAMMDPVEAEPEVDELPPTRQQRRAKLRN